MFAENLKRYFENVNKKIGDMKMVDWITKEQAKEAAEQGKIPALKCSRDHHHQGATCTRGELIDAVKSGQFNIDHELCACCLHYERPNRSKDCLSCPLKNSNPCCNEWSTAFSQLCLFRSDDSVENFQAFQQAESKVCDYIQAVIEKEKAKEEGNQCDDCSYFGKSWQEEPCRSCAGSEFQPKDEKLRHGDCFGDELVQIIVLKVLNKSDEWKLWHKDGSSTHRSESGALSHIGKLPYLGNHFTDIEAMSKDLREFEENCFKAKIGHDGNIQIHVTTNPKEKFSDDYCIYSIPELTKIHQKLGQMIATAKRDEAKK
jgi:hypothetical protein